MKISAQILRTALRPAILAAARAVLFFWPLLLAAPATPLKADAAHAQLVRITILGDSIDSDEPPDRPIQGWGTFLQSKLDNAIVTNLAASGRSTKSYLYGGINKGKRYEPTSWIKAQDLGADFWIIKFGGNDSHPPTEDKHTDPPQYAANLKVFIQTARKLGVRPILATPFRRPFDSSGHLTPELDPYAEAARRVAQEENVPLIDVYAHATEWFTRLGPEGLQAYLPKALGGHMNRAGANLMAEWMAGQLVKIVPQLALAEAAEQAK